MCVGADHVITMDLHDAQVIKKEDMFDSELAAKNCDIHV